MTAVPALAPPYPLLTPIGDSAPDDRLSLEELGSRIVGLAGRLAAATCRWLLLVAEFEARGGHDAWGLPSTARWLSHTCGLSARTAFEHVRVGRALRASAPLVEAMASGVLSYSQVRAIRRVVEPDETGLLAEMIDAAQHCSVGQLEVVLRGLRTVDRNADPHPQDPYVRAGWTPESQWRMNARLDPENGALVNSAIDRIARAEGLTYAQALVRMAEIALAAVADSDHPPRPLRGDERAAVVVQLDAREVATGRIQNGPGLPRRVVERLLCQGRVRTVLTTGESTPLDVGRTRRVVTERQFRALLIRDRARCRHPGCGSTYSLEAHHIKHWLDGGPTNLANLILLCEAHHHAHHDGEFEIRIVGPQRFAFVRHDSRDLSVAEDAAFTRWDGSRLDRHFAVSVLAERRERSRERNRSTRSSPPRGGP